MKNHYIQAVLEMLAAGHEPDQVISGLKNLLHARGHQSLFASVLTGVLRVIEAESDRAGAVVTVAKGSDHEKQAESIKKALLAMGGGDSYQVKEDDTIIGGFIAEVNNTRYDASYKSALVGLYRNLTK